MFSLKDKVAVITGARRGIGKGIAERLAYAGADIVISDIDQEDCDKTAQEIADANSIQAIGVKCDVSNKDEVDSLIAKTVEKFGRIDILVNNAGIVKLDSFTEFREEDWNSVLDINLKGAFLCSQAAAKEMKKNNYGKIISIASIAGLVAYPNGSAYCASKAGIINLTREMAVELAGNKINVNAVAPGLVETPMTRFVMQDKEKLNQTLAAIPWNRPGQPSDIANAVQFLASDEADYITGQTLAVDGGWTIQ
ncbi:glucose 1-dehydrogenase [Candidatus Woesearchaeota archaeon]|nr:glucose 1-dehydrogenase [Candidatus Woesearchaeota archaeon]